MANHLYYGDNLDVLRESVISESVDLVYLDPPFNSNALALVAASCYLRPSLRGLRLGAAMGNRLTVGLQTLTLPV